MSCNKKPSTKLDFSGFLLETNSSFEGLETSQLHPVDICVDRVVRHAPLLLCPYTDTTKIVKRTLPNSSKCLPIDPRPEHTNLASDSYVGAKCKKEQKNN